MMIRTSCRHMFPLSQFYTPWCEHSIEAMGHLYEMMAMLYQNNITGVNFGKVDVSLNPGIC